MNDLISADSVVTIILCECSGVIAHGLPELLLETPNECPICKAAPQVIHGEVLDTQPGVGILFQRVEVLGEYCPQDN